MEHVAGDVLAKDSQPAAADAPVAGMEAVQAPLIEKLEACLASQRGGRTDERAGEISALLGALRNTALGCKGSHFVWFWFCLLVCLSCFLCKL
jgi:hypothetical protein